MTLKDTVFWYGNMHAMCTIPTCYLNEDEDLSSYSTYMTDNLTFSNFNKKEDLYKPYAIYTDEWTKQTMHTNNTIISNNNDGLIIKPLFKIIRWFKNKENFSSVSSKINGDNGGLKLTMNSTVCGATGHHNLYNLTKQGA